MDDIIMDSTTIKEHLARITVNFNDFAKQTLKFNLKIANFLVKKLPYLNHT